MFKFHRLLGVLTIALLMPGFAAAQDRDTKEIQGYVLTDAGLAKYSRASKNIAALPERGAEACGDDDGESRSLDQTAAKLDAAPGVKAAIQSAGMTTREYLVFSMSLLQNGLAAWALEQPGGKLPPGVSKANVDFYTKHAAELNQLEGLKLDDDCEDRSDESESEE